MNKFLMATVLITCCFGNCEILAANMLIGRYTSVSTKSGDRQMDFLQQSLVINIPDAILKALEPWAATSADPDANTPVDINIQVMIPNNILLILNHHPVWSSIKTCD